jgi:hypothetical protein
MLISYWKMGPRSYLLDRIYRRDKGTGHNDDIPQKVTVYNTYSTKVAPARSVLYLHAPRVRGFDFFLAALVEEI